MRFNYFHPWPHNPSLTVHLLGTFLLVKNKFGPFIHRWPRFLAVKKLLSSAAHKSHFFLKYIFNALLWYRQNKSFFNSWLHVLQTWLQLSKNILQKFIYALIWCYFFKVWDRSNRNIEWLLGKRTGDDKMLDGIILCRYILEEGNSVLSFCTMYKIFW
jgi:hypothetical protein